MCTPCTRYQTMTYIMHASSRQAAALQASPCAVFDHVRFWDRAHCPLAGHIVDATRSLTVPRLAPASLEVAIRMYSEALPCTDLSLMPTLRASMAMSISRGSGTPWAPTWRVYAVEQTEREGKVSGSVHSMIVKDTARRGEVRGTVNLRLAHS